MPRGKRNNHRGRGGGRGRGRGGNPTPIVQATTAQAPTRHVYYPNANSQIDVVIQQWAEQDVVVDGNGYRYGNGNLNRGRGSWNGGTPKSRSGAGTPSGQRGMDSPRRGSSTPRGTGWGRGRGRGRGWEPDNSRDSSRRAHFGVSVGPSVKARNKLGNDAPLSDLLYAARPLLRPVKFVRATFTPFLFQHSEDMLKSVPDVVDTTETSHVPTADRVMQVFRENVSDSDSESEHPVELLEEIDFADMALVRAEIDAITQSTVTADQDIDDAQQVTEEVDFADLVAIRLQVDATKPRAASREDVEEVFTGIYNQIKQATQVPSTLDEVQRRASPAPNNSLALKPSVHISNQSNHESITQAQDTIVIEEEVFSSSDIDVDVEEPPLNTAPETDSVPVISDDVSPPSEALEHDDFHPPFVIDTTPTLPLAHRSASDVILVDRTGRGDVLGDQDDDELIVYVAPHPRSGWASPIPAVPRVKLPRTSMLTGKSLDGGFASPVREAGREPQTTQVEGGEDNHLALAGLSLEPATTVSSYAKAALRARKKDAGIRRERQRQNKRGRTGFGAFGAMVSEARLREEERRDPRWETRRKGDSDLEWGTEDEVDAVANRLEGMEIDPDLDLDVNAMQRFVKSMSVEGSRFMTIDDIEDEARIRQEEEESGDEGNSDSERSDEDDEEEKEDMFNMEEEILIAESQADEDEEFSADSDDELSPRSSFQARLRKIRERSRRQRPATQNIDISDDEEEEKAPEIMPGTRGADDENFIARIYDILEENSQILSGRNRKQKKALFHNLHKGYVDEWNVEAFLDAPEYTTPVNKKKKKGKQPMGEFHAELHAQWEKDRAKKAERKREKEMARLRAMLDPLSDGKGKGKRGRKAMRAAARLDPETALSIAPRAIVDVGSLEAQMRRFVAGGRASVALPPMSKGMRMVVHELAAVFGVKSVSKGTGVGRYITLVRTGRTGMGVKEGKVRSMMKRYGGDGGGDKARMPRHREGDVVGKEAPKIGENNIGFKMLASMGWSEGDRIGGTSSVGIEAPLTAIIKHSKLGLGATRS